MVSSRTTSRAAGKANGRAARKGATKPASSSKKSGAAEKTGAPVDGTTDASGPCKIYLLDVGQEKYGDCVLCQLGDVSVLIDGSHRGDDQLVIQQLKELLNQSNLPIRVSLLIVTHPHDDHIGCLPSLVANKQLSPEWALVADPKFRWGEADEVDDFFAGTDHKTRALSEALLEEDRSDLPDGALRDFIDNAGSLVYNYRTMLRQLKKRGTKVVRNGTDDAAALLDAFESIGLTIIGPDSVHLEEARHLVQAARHDSLDSTVDAFTSGLTEDVVTAYRSLMSAPAGAVDPAGGVLDLLSDSTPGCPNVKPNKGAINLQSLVTRFEYDNNSFLFAGDMQFSCPEVESQLLKESVAAMRAEISSGAPYTFVKISHHGSYNAMNEGVLAELGESKLYGICGGVKGSSHPHRAVLKLLDENHDRLRWVRTDRNGLVSITFGDGGPQIEVSRGTISDPEPKPPDETDFADALEEFAGVAGFDSAREVYARVQPGGGLADTFAEAGAGTEVSDDASADAPPRSALAAQLSRANANGWVPFFNAAAQRFNWPVSLLVAIASRETNIRNILGDGGHGHGIMQIDDRSFPEFTSSGDWRIPRLNIFKGAEVLSGKRRFLSGRGVTETALLRASVAAYNGGEGRVLRAIRNGRDVDSVTTQRNYSTDVLARAAVFLELMG